MTLFFIFIFAYAISRNRALAAEQQNEVRYLQGLPLLPVPTTHTTIAWCGFIFVLLELSVYAWLYFSIGMY